MQYYLHLCVKLLFTLMLHSAKSHIFSNPFSLRELFKQELVLAGKMRNSTDLLADSVVSRFLQKLEPVENEIEKASREILDLEEIIWEKLCSNPIHVFQLTRRLQYIQDILAPHLSSPIYGVPHPILAEIGSLMRSHPWPDQIDYKGAIHGLLRVQYTYQLPIASGLAKGRIRDRFTLARLDAADCYFLAQERIEGRNPLLVEGGIDYAIAIEWAEAAIELLKSGRDQGEVSISEVETFTAQIKEQHDLNFMSPSPGGGWSKYPNEHFFIKRFANDSSLTGQLLRLEERNVFSKRASSKSLEYHLHIRDYHTLCRGESIMLDGKVPFNGFCELRTNAEPWLLLAPVKTEVISEDPAFPLYVLHDVLTANEIGYLIEKSAKRMARAGLYLPDSEGINQDKFSFERTQSHAWIWEYEHQLVQKVSRRLDKMTGLEVSNVEHLITASEAYQVGVYAPGGLYLPHYDSLSPLDSYGKAPDGTWIGNRIATAMFYLSDLDGGATVFPNQGLAVFPSKGSLALWYNLKQNGSQAPESLHGACPSLFGIKWVSNKWIREGSQVFKRPCSTAQHL